MPFVVVAVAVAVLLVLMTKLKFNGFIALLLVAIAIAVAFVMGIPAGEIPTSSPKVSEARSMRQCWSSVSAP